MIPYTAQQLADAVHGTLVGGLDPGTVADGDVTLDSRRITPGGVFVAFAGQNADGHDFCGRARDAGAALSIVSRDVGVPAVLVEDARRALADLARAHLERLRPGGPGTGDLTVVALTGSAGKTGTKDAIGALLATSGPTVAPAGSHNNELGLPLTVLTADESARFLVLEMGARGRGHITYLTDIAAPDIAVELNVCTAHLGEFGSVDAIAEAKAELVQALTAAGTAVLNADDPRVAAMADRTDAPVIRYGVERTDVDVAAVDVDLDDGARPVFTLVIGQERHPVRLPLVGEHQVYTALAAAAVAHAAGQDTAAIAAGLQRLAVVSRHRMEVTARPDGVTVINDAYNASPDSVRSALKSLAVIGRGRRTIAVLGPMRELGPDSVVLHDEIGRTVVKLDVDQTLVVGTDAEAHALWQGAVQEGSWGTEALIVDDVDGARAFLTEDLRPGDVVLIKASHSIGLHVLGDELAHPRR